MECCGVNWPKDWMDYNTLYQGDSFAVAGDSYLMAMVPKSCCAVSVDQVICLNMNSCLCVSHTRTCEWSLLLLQMVLLSRAALLWCRVRLSIISLCLAVSALQSLSSWSALIFLSLVFTPLCRCSTCFSPYTCAPVG